MQDPNLRDTKKYEMDREVREAMLCLTWAGSAETATTRTDLELVKNGATP